MSVGVYAGESNALREFLLSQSNIDAYKRINTTAGWKKAAGRTLCSAVDFSQTEHLRRFGSWVVHPPTSQAQQRVKLRGAVQRTYKAGQQCKEGLNWTEYKDEPFHLSFFMEYVAMPPAMQSAASAQPDARVQQHDSAVKPLQPIASNGGSLAALASVHKSTASAIKLRMWCPTGSTLGAWVPACSLDCHGSCCNRCSTCEQTTRCAALAASTGGAC